MFICSEQMRQGIGFQTHFRNVHTGIDAVLGHFGSGKTSLVANSASSSQPDFPGQRLIACNSNSAWDAIVPGFTTSRFTIVRVHTLSPERETLLKD